MFSPMQRHIQEARKKQEQKAIKEKLDQGTTKPASESPSDYSEFEVIKASAEQDHAAIGNTAKDDRDTLRTSLVKRYMGHIEAYLNGGEVFANPVLVYVIIWLFDLKRIGEALKLAFVAIEQDQKMTVFKRNLATWVADTVRDWAEAEHKEGRTVEPYFYQVFEMLGGWPVPSVVAMKYNKLAGLIAFDNEDFETAIKYFEAAEALQADNAKAQVGTKLKEAKKKLAKLSQDKTES